MTLSKQLDQGSYTMCPSCSDYSNTFRVVRVEKIKVFLRFVEDFANQCLKHT